jgi:hypothetical protein
MFSYEFTVPNNEGDYDMSVLIFLNNSKEDKIINMSKSLRIQPDAENENSDDDSTKTTVSIPTYDHGAYLEVSFKSKDHGYDALNKGRDIFNIINTVKATVKDAIEKVKKRGLALVMIYSTPLTNSSKVDTKTGQIKYQNKNTRKKLYDYLYDDLVKTGVFKKFTSGSYAGVYSTVRPRKPRVAKPKVAPKATNLTTNDDLSSLSYDDRTLAISRIVRPPVSARVNTTNQGIMNINKYINNTNTFIHTAIHGPNSTGHVSKIDAINDDGDEIILEFNYISDIDFVPINGVNTLVTLTNYYPNNEETSQFVKDHKDEFVNLIED